MDLSKKFVVFLMIILTLHMLPSLSEARENESGLPVVGLDYSFEVPSIYTEITILEDGSIDIYYRFEFVNDLSADPIDVIDVGYPNVYYQLKSVRAWLNGTEIFDIRKSEVVEIGVEVWLDDVGYIYAGQTGIFEIEGHNPKMVYDDSTEGLASVVFYQTWYDYYSTSGSTNRTVRFFFPEDLTDILEVDYRIASGSEFTRVASSPHGPFVEFSSMGTPYDSYDVGVAFPKEYSKTFNPFWTLLVWGSMVRYPMATVIVSIIVLAIIIAIIRSIRNARRYLPPSISSLGGGIREDLMPSEVAILMERPLTQVASLMLFELMERGYARIQTKEPELRLQITATDPVIADFSKPHKTLAVGIRKRNKEDETWIRGAASGAIPKEPVHQNFFLDPILAAFSLFVCNWKQCAEFLRALIAIKVFE